MHGTTTDEWTNTNELIQALRARGIMYLVGDEATDEGENSCYRALSDRAHWKPGRVYLVGGSALVHAGLHPGATRDIDLDIHAANEDELSEAIRRLKDSAKVNVEFASPADFIPLPSQWESNARYIGRYGTIDAFYFDFYSIALSKIERGNNRDINDVYLLLQSGYIDLAGLDAAYQEILPRVAGWGNVHIPGSIHKNSRNSIRL
jgi:hypothetical protein